jgi:cation-transporting ATPase G
VIVLTLVPLAAFGVLSLATVVFVHELAEVFVIGNGVRAGRLRPLRGETAPEPVVTQRIPVTAESEEDGCACCAPAKEEPARPQMLTLSPISRNEPRRTDLG